MVVIGTGGKGTGAGTIFPVVRMAREQRKLVIPIFVRPSFERHEVDKRRYDHALSVVERFDGANIRLIEILNDHGYAERPAASIRRVGTDEPTDRERIARSHVRAVGFVASRSVRLVHAVRRRWQAAHGICGNRSAHGTGSSRGTSRGGGANLLAEPYYAFSKPVGTSLVCIQGHWSNVVDAAIKGGLAAMANAGVPESTYTPLYARAVQVPRPWGVTALFAEHTGTHAPLDIDWGAERRPIVVRAPVSRFGDDRAPLPRLNHNRPLLALPAGS